MKTTIASVESFCNLLNKSRLLKSQEVQSRYRHWRRYEKTASAGELKRFVKWLMMHHYLTEYQAQQLMQGRIDQFFLNHYRLLDLIGKGRMAGIFKSSHTLGHIVAVKVMPTSKSRDPKLLARFQREARMAARLKHANIVRTFHMGQAGRVYYIVMEYLEGETLDDILKRRRKLPFAEGVRIIHQTLLGLQHIHEQGMVHRDFTPGNLMLVPPPPPGAEDNTLHATVKILDIGMGRILFDEGMKADADQMQLTTEGMMLGTPEYMSPEQAKDAHNIDIRTDIYSLGCVLYHVLTGQTPFTDKQVIQQLMKHATQKPQPVRELEPSVPQDLQAVVETMLAKDPIQRFVTPAQAAKALQKFLPAEAGEQAEASSLVQSYLQWVEDQPEEEVSAAPAAVQKWFYKRADKTFGPVTSDQVNQLVTAGKLLPNDLLWMEGDNPALAVQAKAALCFPGLEVEEDAAKAAQILKATVLAPSSPVKPSVPPPMTKAAPPPATKAAPPPATKAPLPPAKSPSKLDTSSLRPDAPPAPVTKAPLPPAKSPSKLDTSSLRPDAPPAPPVTKVVPPPAAKAPAPPQSSPSVEEMGYDPDTGQVLDAAKFKRWQEQEKIRKDREMAAAPTTHEIFIKARNKLDQWIDLDQNRRLVMIGDLELIRQEPAIEEFMRHHAQYGQEILHKLWHHMQFMVENRRKYYSVFN